MDLKCKKVNDIISDNIIVEMHYDMLKDVLFKRRLGGKKIIETFHLPELIKGGFNVVVSSIFVESVFLPEMALRIALDQISFLYSEIEESGDKIALCKSYAEIISAVKSGKLAIVLSFEGAEPILNDSDLLRVFYELGVRLIGLTWSRRNHVGDGSSFFPAAKGKQGGLTDFGVKVVEAAEKLRMIIDVSHINDEGFWDVFKFSQTPIIASHSNCRGLVDYPRNLSDDMIKTIAEREGIIGINAVNILAADDDENTGPHTIVDQIDYIGKLVGIDHAGIGFDLCDKIMGYTPAINPGSMKRKPFDILKGHGEMRDVIGVMLERGYTDKEIGKVLGGNFLRVLKKCL